MFHQVGAFVKSLFINWSFEVYALIDAEDATVPEDSKKLLKGYSVAFRKPVFFSFLKHQNMYHLYCNNAIPKNIFPKVICYGDRWAKRGGNKTVNISTGHLKLMS